MIETIAARLNEWKKEQGLTSQKLADLSNVPKQSVDRILSATTERPSFENIMQLTIALGHSLDELIGAPAPKGSTVEVSHYDLLLQSYKDQIETHRILHQKAIETHTEEKTYLRKCMLIELGVILVLVIALVALFAYDIADGHVGWFRYVMEHFNDSLGTYTGITF